MISVLPVHAGSVKFAKSVHTLLPDSSSLKGLTEILQSFNPLIRVRTLQRAYQSKTGEIRLVFCEGLR